MILDKGVINTESDMKNGYQNKTSLKKKIKQWFSKYGSWTPEFPETFPKALKVRTIFIVIPREYLFALFTALTFVVIA